MSMRVACLALVLAALVLASLWQPNDPFALDLSQRHAGMTFDHPLGTDHLGRCLLSRLMIGAGNTALVVVLVAGLSFSLGVVVGTSAAIAGGAAGIALLRTAELVIAVPTLVLALTITTLVGLGPVTAGFALGLASWGPYALLAYALASRTLGRPHVLAARAMGVGQARIARCHVLPETMGTMRAYVAADAGRTVVSYASLAFLGLGAETSRPDWGAMLFEYRGYVFDAPMLMVWPGIAISLTALLLNLAIEPRSPDVAMEIRR